MRCIMAWQRKKEGRQDNQNLKFEFEYQCKTNANIVNVESKISFKQSYWSDWKKVLKAFVLNLNSSCTRKKMDVAIKTGLAHSVARFLLVWSWDT